MARRSQTAKEQPPATLSQDVAAVASDGDLEDSELTLEEMSSHPILQRVAQRISSNARTTSHTAHNSHYSSNA